MERTLAHISDLHLGRDRQTDANVARLAGALCEAGVDAVLVTGDVTHRGRRAELALFDAPAPLPTASWSSRGTSTVSARTRRASSCRTRGSPSRYGRACTWCGSTPRRPTTGRSSAHGSSRRATSPRSFPGGCGAAGHARRPHAAPPPAPAPEDHLSERLASWLGWPNAAELARGRTCSRRSQVAANLVAHGHRRRLLDRAAVRPAARSMSRTLGARRTWASLPVLLHADGQLLAARRLDLTRLRVTPAARLPRRRLRPNRHRRVAPEPRRFVQDRPSKGTDRT